MQESTVYLVQIPPVTRKNDGSLLTKDLSSAQRYGKIHPLLQRGEQPSLTPGPVLHLFLREMKNFDPTMDSLCFAGGDPMGLALALVALKEMNFKEVTVLRWERERATDGRRDASGGFYVPVLTPLRL